MRLLRFIAIAPARFNSNITAVNPQYNSKNPRIALISDMLIERGISTDTGLDDWAFRAENWITELPKLQKTRLRRQRNPNPLILAGHGVSLRIDKGTLVIKEGFTHYPQKQIEHRYFPGDLELPRIIMLLDGSGSLSFDVLSWLSEQGTSLVRVKYDGSIAIVAGAGFRVNPEKLKWQFELQSNEVKRIEFAKELIAKKLLNCAATLKSQFGHTDRRERAIAKNENGAAQLKSGCFSNMGEIRAIEGEAAAAYFSIWSAITMKWTAQSRYPVPKSWNHYLSRSSALTGKLPKNKNAAHPVNAMLNYAYAVKASQLQMKAISDGFDPYSGIMHHARDDFPAYIYDMIEPERPKVDATILKFAQSRKFSGADFILRKDGVCRLSPQLARVVAMLVSG
jgi:CRISPR-associated endonuclease Cas1